jgi:predicted nucleotidyltransferase
MNNLERALHALAEQYNLLGVYVFGSRAPEIAAQVRGEPVRPAAAAHPDSDVDIAVLPMREYPLAARDRVRLMLALEETLNVTRVDLVILPEADPFLAANVVRGERLYAQDRYLADEYDLYILRRAGDLATLERERMALILGKEQ